MPIPPRRPPRLRRRVFRGSHAVASGILTRGELRSRAWRPLFRDIYADARIIITHPVRCATVARLLLPAEAAIAGRSAAALFGAGAVRTDEPIDVLVPTGTRFGPVSGLRVHCARLSDGDLVRHGDLTVTSPARTAWDVAQWLDTVDAVVVIDALLARRVVTAASLRDYAAARAGQRGWQRLRRTVELADAGAESPPESRLRVRLILAGVPRPVTQYVVESDGRFVARVDLAWPELKVAVEYDGTWHADTEQFHRDRRRLNRLLGEGWLVLHVTGKRLREDFAGVLAEVRAALRSRQVRRAG
ncbi:DUF559 domain-containing protein [Micromonospora sp. CPCC 206060]|uniref:endonuclease domain-containing protein n=1 Tax=Micromonospora sp. CPCC 206060 TaxID=3122406 RepID=UPI002FEF4D05